MPVLAASPCRPRRFQEGRQALESVRSINLSVYLDLGDVTHRNTGKATALALEPGLDPDSGRGRGIDRALEVPHGRNDIRGQNRVRGRSIPTVTPSVHGWL